MVNAHPLTSCKAVFKKLNILTLPCLYISQLILHIRANENNFVRNHEIHSHNTRSNQRMRQPFSRLDIGQKSPNCIGIKCYNKINFFKTSDSMNVCKNKLNKFLVSNCFYSVDEFLEYQ